MVLRTVPAAHVPGSCSRIDHTKSHAEVALRGTETAAGRVMLYLSAAPAAPLHVLQPSAGVGLRPRRSLGCRQQVRPRRDGSS